MPNTLAHIGIQGVVTRWLIRDADIKWMFLGLVIPDIPWINLRVAMAVLPAIDPIDIRIIAIAQSSLFFCIVISVALALFSRRPGVTTSILGLNSFLHLLVDACQTKWGNGVILFAPFNWEIINFGFFWPDSWPTYLLTISGLFYVIFIPIKINEGDLIDLVRPRSLRKVFAILLIAIYLCLPFAFIKVIESKDSHSVATIRNPCVNCPVAFDRADFRKEADKNTLNTWSRQSYRVAGLRPEHSAKVSIRGKFRDSSTILVEDLYLHHGFNRDIPSYIGLAVVLVIWGKSIWVLRK